MKLEVFQLQNERPRSSFVLRYSQHFVIMQGFDLNAFAALAQQVPQQHFQQPVAPMQPFGHQAAAPVQNNQLFGLQQPQFQGAPQQQYQQPGQFQQQQPMQQQWAPPQQQQQQFQAPPQQQYQQPQVSGFQILQNPGFGQVQQPQQTQPAIPIQQFQPQVPPPMQAPPVQQAAVQPPVPAPNAIFFSEEWHPQFGFLSNFFPAPFAGTKGNCKYMSVEQYYVEKKARCAKDEEVRKAIMAVTWNVFNAQGQIDFQTSRQGNLYLKQLGQKIRNLNEDEWDKVKTQVMRTALMYKFAQNQPLYDLLMQTGEDVLFEASEDDVWAIGCNEQQARSGQVPMSEWGSNLTGFLLMEIRGTFRKTGKPEWAIIQAAKPEVSMTRSEVSGAAPVVVATTLPAPAVDAAAPPAGNAIAELLKEEPKKEEIKPVIVAEAPAVVETAKVEEVKATPAVVAPAANPLMEVMQEAGAIPPQTNPLTELVPTATEVKPVEIAPEHAGVVIATTMQPPVPAEIKAEPVVASGTINPLTLIM